MVMDDATADHGLGALFASYRRVIYDENPLVEVVLQVRFPTYLRLQSEPPSNFQDRILAEYPHYEMQRGLEVKISAPNAPPTLLESNVHIFYSGDKYWRLALSQDYIMLSTKRYKKWEEFKERTDFCLKSFFDIYPIKVITRIGLRYRDLIKRSRINKVGSEWPKLINPLILGPMGSTDFRSIPVESARWLQRFAVGDLKIDFQGGVLSHEGEQSYFLDCDVSLSKETIAGSAAFLSELERIHEPIGPLFKWAITDELHTALGPKPA
jgi:uncharacterized protein (TIGR04255 family)